MNKKESVLGIDLGTSSVKVLQRYIDGTVVKAKATYDETSPNAWWKAIKQALTGVQLEDVVAIGLSSQVGTYIIDDKEVISWNCGIGSEELEQIRNEYVVEEFIEEISMPHPNIVSYPIPRLLYIKKQYPNVQRVCQPKDFICEKLTGNRVTDSYSWRGLANLKTKRYSQKFLNVIGIEKEVLPKIVDYMDMAGYTVEIELEDNLLPKGIPVYVGLNDYFASLLGMGIENVGDMFDISGTSEHLGIIEDSINIDTKMVSGPYLNANVHYGVTASSGASLDFGLQLLKDGCVNLEEVRKHQPPIFLPYLNGERAPIWDADARGMFFGIEAPCTKEDMMYSVMEGVVFSLYHIYESMGKPKATRMKIAGGAAVNSVLNHLKAEMFEIPVAVLEENDTSALGASMIAATGIGWFEDLSNAIAKVSDIKEQIEPTGKYKEWLDERFAIYKELYPAVKKQYEEFRRIAQ